MVLQYLGKVALLGSLAVVLSAPAAAVTASVGALPQTNGVTIAFASDEAVQGSEQMAQCLAEAGMRQATPATYLVQFTRSVRPRKTLVELGPQDGASRGDRRPPRWGKRIEVAALTVSEIATGKVLLQAEAAQKVGGKGQGQILTELCSAIRRAGLQPVRPG